MIKSPCVNVCKLDQHGVCVGCGRTERDIANWASMTEQERFETVERAAAWLRAKNKLALLSRFDLSRGQGKTLDYWRHAE